MFIIGESCLSNIFEFLLLDKDVWDGKPLNLLDYFLFQITIDNELRG